MKIWPDNLDYDAAAADTRGELRIQQEIVSRLSARNIHWALLTLLSHGLRQFQWVEKQRRLIKFGRAARLPPD